MAQRNKDTESKRIKPFVKKGEMLGYASALKEKGLYPPRLHNRKDHNDNDRKPTATPYLLIPAMAGDNGSRPLANSQVFHSQGIWLEDLIGNVITTPVIGNQYVIKCRVLNIGAFASYGGLADFYLEKPELFNALAGMPAAILPAFGRTGFSVLPGEYKDIKCPHNWHPKSPDDLLSSILVQVYDPISGDNIISRFDARIDRHVGRHDFTSDFYVRDWTVSAGMHDLGSEPSTYPQFYVRSDVWNRRNNDPGPFVNDQPTNQDPQAGNGAAGDNFMFARISRNNATNEESVKAHFLFAEFGTGSPYIDCSAAPDPEVTFLPGETSKIIFLPWHLHPTSSQHLCIGVQVYSAADSYMPPGLLGYTPGWPTTDLMVINDNNKAQKNIKVWDGIAEEAGMHFAMIFNNATFLRDFELSFSTSQETMRRFNNARIMLHGSDQMIRLTEKGTLKVANMLPGERRWITFSYDGFSASAGETLEVLFNEVVNNKIVNGFCFHIKEADPMNAMGSTLQQQLAAFSRLEAMGVKQAEKGIFICKRLLEEKPNAEKYLQTLPGISQLLMASTDQMSQLFGGLKDSFDVWENIRLLGTFKDAGAVSKAIALHQKLLNQLDTWQTIAIKSKGDEAGILFTVRLQKEVYCREQLVTGYSFPELLRETDMFIKSYSIRKVTNKDYPGLVSYSLQAFKTTVELNNTLILRQRLQDLERSLKGSLTGIQKAHEAFLNDVLQMAASKKNLCG
jgi:hypothetical protein